MLTLDATQQSIVASNTVEVYWLFEVTIAGPTTYYWSTKTVPDTVYNGQAYSFKVIADSFQGITLNRAKSEAGMQAPSTTRFTITNPSNALSADDFVDQTVLIRLVVDNGTDCEQIAVWGFIITECSPGPQKLNFSCEDFLQAFIKGDWPNTQRVSSLVTGNWVDDWISHNPSMRPFFYDTPFDYVVPIPFGLPVIPLTSLFLTDGRYYILGPTAGGLTYSISYVRSPNGWGTGAPTTWNSPAFTFTQATKTIDTVDYRVFQPIVADFDEDGNADSVGLWKTGDKYLDIPTKFSRSDTAALTSFELILEYILENFGVPSALLDTGAGSSFEAAGTTYSGWGLTAAGAFTNAEQREKIIAALLIMSNSTLRMTNKIELHPLSKTSRGTVTYALRNDDGISTFEQGAAIKPLYDCGYIAFYGNADFYGTGKKLVKPAGTQAAISNEVLSIGFVQDSQLCQRIGELYFLKKLYKSSNIRFDHSHKLLAIQPDDVITINNANYGGTYDAMVDSLQITKDLILKFQCSKYSTPFQDFADSTPVAIVPAVDTTTNFWAAEATGGYDTGAAPSAVTNLAGEGAPRAVKFTWDRSLNPNLYFYDFMFRITADGGAPDSGWDANYQQTTSPYAIRFLTVAEQNTYGANAKVYCKVRVADRNLQKSATAEANASCTYLNAKSPDIVQVAGWTASLTALTCDSGIVGLNSEITVGTDWRFWAGHATPGSAPFRVDEAGNLYATSATITGTITATAGVIGGFTVSAAEGLYAGTGATRVQMKPGAGIWAGATAIGDAPFSVTQAGVLKATSGTIGGWTLAAGSLSDANITIDSANHRIRSANYVTGPFGAGFTLEPDLLEVGNIAARGMIRTAVFQKDVISAVGGSLLIRPADTLATDMTALDASTLTVKGTETFAVNDILRIKDATYDEWLLVTNIASAPTYTVTRDRAAAYGANANPAWPKGAAVVNYGASGKGGILLTSSLANAPYMQIFTHAGSPWSAITTRAKLGNLNGSYGYVAETYGMAAGEYGAASNTWITVDATNGIRIGNNATVIGQWDTSGNILIGQTGAGQSNVYITSGAVYLRTNTTNKVTLSTAGVITIGTVSAGVNNVFIDDGGIYLRTNTTNKVTLSAAGVITIGTVSAGVNNVYIDGGGIYLRTNTTNIISITSAGVASLTINDGGSINLNDGGDIVLQTDDANPSIITWKDGATAKTNLGGRVTGYTGVSFWPETINTGVFMLGYDMVGDAFKPFATIYQRSQSQFYLEAYYDANDYSNISMTAASGSGGILILKTYGMELLLRDGKAAVNTNLDGFAATFFNDGNNANRNGILILCGADDGVTGTTYAIGVQDGNGDWVGAIENNAGTFQLVDLSDESVKTSISSTSINGLGIIRAIPVDDFYKLNNEVLKTGFIAQKLQKIYPSAVSVLPNGLLGVSKVELMAPVVKAIQENDARITILETEIELLKKAA